MEFKDTQEITFMRNTLKETMDIRFDIQRKENEQSKRLAEAVQANVRSAFENFGDGDKVRVTYKSGGWYGNDTTTRELFFRKPTCMGHLNGTAACDYEIRFHGVNKDGSESKRGDLYENCIPVGRILSIEKI